jgi:hypothetical protein
MGFGIATIPALGGLAPLNGVITQVDTTLARTAGPRFDFRSTRPSLASIAPLRLGTNVSIEGSGNRLRIVRSGR